MSDDFIDEKTIISPRTTPAGDATDTTNDPLIGQRIGNYLILSILGRGGFGSIYKAEYTKLGRMVALKFLIHSNDEFHSELFEREAKALGKLSKHPHIVQIHAWDEHEGNNFFVLEFMDTSVADLLKQSPNGIDPARAVQIIAECADALTFAHESNILHRDIKSPNILIECPDGKAKVADFGLARICGTSSNTIEGSVIGSPAYMAPELARGGEVTPLCDIYSLGATLHEMLSGKVLFSGSSVLAVLEKVRTNERDDLKILKPGLPTALYAIVAKATAHDPEARYQTAKELAEALRDIDIESLVSVDTETKDTTATKNHHGSISLPFWPCCSGCIWPIYS
jgi:serine/threonine protein kinase